MNDTAELLDAVETYWRRFLAATDDQIIALCVWTLHTYVYDVFNTTPYLIVTSAEMRSGKSTILEILDVIARKPFYTTGVTEAVLFRMIAQDKPTLLLDEQDRALKEHHGQLSERQEMIVAIINLGYRKRGRVPRMTPQLEIAMFPTFCPKALAGIGRMPHTIEDRGLPLRMVRMSDAMDMEEFDEDLVGADGYALAKRCEDWAHGAKLALAGVLPAMPAELDRRAKQAYRVLVGVGDLAGDPWSERIRASLVALRVEASESPKESQGVRLLRDVSIFADRLGRMERIATHDFLAWLYEHGEQPYEDWWGESSGKKAARRLALVLGEYGVKPSKWKDEGVTVRGYLSDPILGAMRLYVPNTPPNATEDWSRDSEGAVAFGGVSANGASPHGMGGVAFGGVLDPGSGDGTPPGADVGSDEWLATASMDELRLWSETLDNDEGTE